MSDAHGDSARLASRDAQRWVGDDSLVTDSKVVSARELGRIVICQRSTLRRMSHQMSPDFASLQLRMVDRFVELGLVSYQHGVDQLTNLQRRLGIGSPTDSESNPTWLDLVGELSEAASHDERVDIVMSAHSSLPPAVPEHIARQWPTVGAFSIEIVGTVARTHFYALDDDDTSPLAPEKRRIRRQELNDVLAVARSEHPEIERVAGGSWMYSTASYASLFPEAHVANATIRRGRATFRGMSHWGQFLDHRSRLRPNLADEFRRRCRAWTGGDPCLLFPIDTLEVNSPVEIFDSAT